MPIELKPLRGVWAYIHSGLTEIKRSMDMGKVIAFPDMKSRLHHLSADTEQRQTLPQTGSGNNVILFDGVFVEYHDKVQKAEQASANSADKALTSVAQNTDAGWRHHALTRKAETRGPENSPQFRRR
jgi:hypothetical protein